MRAVANGVDRRLGGADQPRNLCVGQVWLVTQQPGYGVRLVRALGYRCIARAFLARYRVGNIRCRELQPGRRIRFATLDFLTGQLAIGNGVKADNADRDFTIGNRLDFQFVQITKNTNLQKCQCSVFNQPDGGRLRHQKRSHDKSSNNCFPCAGIRVLSTKFQ